MVGRNFSFDIVSVQENCSLKRVNIFIKYFKVYAFGIIQLDTIVLAYFQKVISL